MISRLVCQRELFYFSFASVAFLHCLNSGLSSGWLLLSFRFWLGIPSNKRSVLIVFPCFLSGVRCSGDLSTLIFWNIWERRLEHQLRCSELLIMPSTTCADTAQLAFDIYFLKHPPKRYKNPTESFRHAPSADIPATNKQHGRHFGSIVATAVIHQRRTPCQTTSHDLRQSD